MGLSLTTDSYHSGRTMTANIDVSGTSLSWSITLNGGSVNYYDSYARLSINNKNVYESSKSASGLEYPDEAFPAGYGGLSVSGTTSLQLGINPVTFETYIFSYTKYSESDSVYVYKIEYYGNGSDGGSNPGSHYTSHAQYTEIKSNTFTKTGYTFGGWTTNSDGTDDGEGWTGWSGTWSNNYRQDSVVEYVLKLYARWIPNKISIQYYPSGGSVSSNYWIKSSDKTDPLNTYGWIAEKKADGSITRPFHYVNYSSTTPIKSYSDFGLTRTGYTGSQWIPCDGLGADVSGTTITGGNNLTASNFYNRIGNGTAAFFKAKWTPVLTIKYYGNGATSGTFKGNVISNPEEYIGVTEEFIYTSNYQYGLSNIQNSSHIYLSRTGYQPTGYWMYNNDSNKKCHQDPITEGYPSGMTGKQIAQKFGVYSTDNSTPGTINVYAQWTPNTYTVKYNANGGTGITVNSSHTYDTAKNLNPNEFIKTGYKFIGWNTESDGSGTFYADEASVINLTAINNGIVNLYAQWEIEGNVRIYVDGEWKMAIPYIYISEAEGWKRAIPYINTDGTSSGWKQCGG